VVLDLGSGGGLDVFLAADLVGPTGIVVGLDGSQVCSDTPRNRRYSSILLQDMINLARRNAKSKGVRPPQVAFAQASLTEELPIESMSVNCIISNCVLNLLPSTGKSAVLKEAFRVLKPGGRIHLADVSAFSQGSGSCSDRLVLL
jgi:ubiquinone/menaquinone biosynthesis C-methylase UbiE